MKRWVPAIIVAVLGLLAGAAIAGRPTDVDDLHISGTTTSVSAPASTP